MMLTTSIGSSSQVKDVASDKREQIEGRSATGFFAALPFLIRRGGPGDCPDRPLAI
jgi:hypothetical protein